MAEGVPGKENPAMTTCAMPKRNELSSWLCRLRTRVVSLFTLLAYPPLEQRPTDRPPDRTTKREPAKGEKKTSHTHTHTADSNLVPPSLLAFPSPPPRNKAPRTDGRTDCGGLYHRSLLLLVLRNLLQSNSDNRETVQFLNYPSGT